MIKVLSAVSEHKDKCAELKHKEDALIQDPSIEGYLELAEAYSALGLNKESMRMVQKAEELEKDHTHATESESTYLLEGSLNLNMLVEILQVLHRTKRTGELVIEQPASTSHIYFCSGEVIHATNMLESDGITSLHAVFRYCVGTYRFIEKEVDDIEHSIDEACESLIMKALTYIDEQKA